jgi:hypothetical protein
MRRAGNDCQAIYGLGGLFETLRLVKYEVNCSSEVGMDRECEPLADRRPCRVSVL